MINKVEVLEKSFRGKIVSSTTKEAVSGK